MAYPISLTIGTGNKVTINYQSNEVSVSLAYQLEREDTDVLAVARSKSAEVLAVHGAVWEQVRGSNPVELASVSSRCLQPVTQTTEAATPAAEKGDAETVAEPSGVFEEKTTKTREGNNEPSMPGQHLALRALLRQSGFDQAGVQQCLLARFECEALETLSYDQASQWLLELQRSERERVRSHRTAHK